MCAIRLRRFPATLIFVAGSFFAFALCAHAHEDGSITHHVANNGLDSPTCGTATQPCRSIGRAIQRASDGDTIRVRPGLYGDINGDGDFDDAGDELLDSTSFNSSCLVCVNKAVRLVSTHGAELTIIDGTGTEAFGAVRGVIIAAPGVTFGADGHGLR